MSPQRKIGRLITSMFVLAAAAAPFFGAQASQEDKAKVPQREKSEPLMLDSALSERNIMMGPLIRAGVKVESASDLCVVLRTNYAGMEEHASFALRLLPRSDEAVDALNEALKSKNEGLVVTSARTLQKLGQKDWVPVARERLPSFESRANRLLLAGMLAEAGAYDGWPFIVKTLTDPDADRLKTIHALVHVLSFVGMKDAAGKPVDLAEELRSLLPKVAPANRDLVLWDIKQLSHLSTPKPAPTQP